MITGSNCIRYATLKDWHRFVRQRGPAQALTGSLAMKKFARDEYEASLGRLDEAMRKIEEGRA